MYRTPPHVHSVMQLLLTHNPEQSVSVIGHQIESQRTEGAISPD